VRELENRVQRAVILADGPQVNAVDLDLEPPEGAETGIPTLRAVRDQAEQAAVVRAMAAAGGNMSMAARLLGVSRPKLYDLMKQHGIQTDRPLSEVETADTETPG
jgi:two-component system NtrC family response regulator